MKRFFSSQPVRQQEGLAAVRLIVGFFLAYHGCEIFDGDKMKEYAVWDALKGYSSPKLMVYVGKGAELVAGFMLAPGILTRLACIIIIITMLYISLFVGNGKVWYEDQHPFMFVLMGFVFLFTGAGKYSVDYLLSKKKLKENG